MQRIYIRSADSGFELMVDGLLHSQLGWVDVCNAIIELTKILRHGKGDVVLTINRSTLEMSFLEAIQFLTQATSSLRH